MPLTLKWFYDAYPWKFGYDNVYIFTDWIFWWTDTNPRGETIYSGNTIYCAWYDRREMTLWIADADWIWYYNHANNTVSHLSAFGTSGSWYEKFVFLDDYILYTASASTSHPYFIYNRRDKLFERQIDWISGTYSDKDVTQTYYTNEYLVVVSSWNVTTNVYDIRDWSKAFDCFGTQYHQSKNFWNLITVTCENWTQNFYLYSNSSSNVRPFSWGNYEVHSIGFWDSWLLDRVTQDDFEYDKIFVNWCRTNSDCKIVTHSGAVYASYSWVRLSGIPIKYNTTYCIGKWRNTSSDVTWIYLYHKWNWTVTRIGTSSDKLIFNITWAWNICQRGAWIYNINWTAVYTNGNFITGISKRPYVES